MSKYVFPAVFTPEGEFYVVDFPDIPNCYTQGEGLNDALEMANDVLCLTLYHMEKEGKTIPLPSDIHDIKINENNSFVSLVGCDTFEYQKFYEKKSIKRLSLFRSGSTQPPSRTTSIFPQYFKPHSWKN